MGPLIFFVCLSQSGCANVHSICITYTPMVIGPSTALPFIILTSILSIDDMQWAICTAVYNLAHIMYECAAAICAREDNPSGRSSR